jgi:CSLREA domain-containing protein
LVRDDSIRFRARRAGLAALLVLLSCLLGPAAASATDIDVDTTLDMTADDDQCTLREAVNAANTNLPQGPAGAGPDCPAGAATLDRILLDAGATYGFMSGTIDDGNLTGDIDVAGIGPVSVEGTGSPAPTIDSNDLDRALHALDATPGDTLTIDGIRITDNRALAGGGGGMLVSGNTTVNVSDSTITQNLAGNASGSHEGGGLRVDGTLVMTSSVVLDNDAISTDPAGTGTGGGIEVTSIGSATVVDSVIADNGVSTASVTVAINGAGINNTQGALVVRRSVISGNQVTGGAPGSRRAAGILAGLGGTASATLVNSTISGNLGAADGGGVYVNQNVPVQIIHTTIAENTATDQGAAIQQDDGGATPDVTIRGSVLAGPSAANVCGFFNTPGGFSSGNHNVALGTTCGLGMPNDAQNVDPMLGGLGDNGGPSVGAPGFQQVLRTHAVSMGTAPFDRVPTGACLDEMSLALTVDQRGSGRPSGSACDSGAFELAVPAPPPPPPPATPLPSSVSPTASGENPECATLRAKLKRAKSKKKKRKIRKRMRALGC